MRDVELSTEARRLIDSARPDHEPSAIEQARVRRSLEWKLGMGVMLTVTQAAPFLSAAVKVTLAVVATGAVGTGAYLGARAVKEHAARRPAVEKMVVARSPAVAPASEERVSPPLPDEHAPPAMVVAPTPVQTPGPKRREPRPAPAPVAQPALPDLGAEMALLQTANAALGRGQVEQALSVLANYDRTFGTGQLAEERSALGVLALCAAGRNDEAIRAHKRFLQRWPKSPLVARLVSSCAASEPRRE
jgi:hypothetical protein